jgi:hypothetical protein
VGVYGEFHAAGTQFGSQKLTKHLVMGMAYERYFIVFDRGHWRIKRNGQLSEPFASQALAVRAAINAAYHKGSYGNQAQVLVRGDDRLFDAVWIYGLDTYPPSQKLLDLCTNEIVHQEAVTLAGTKVRCPCHVCGLFNGLENQYAVLLPFLREGWEQRESTLILLEKGECDHRLRRLKDYGIDVEAAQQSGQLRVEFWEHAYLRDGRFDPVQMLEFVKNALTSAYHQGFARTRIWANMEWALTGAPGVEALAEYESRLNLVLPQLDDAVVCAYDVARFPAVILEDVVRAHPYLLADGWGGDNPHYVAPPN